MTRSDGDWFVLNQSQPTMLSSVYPADARKPGPVIGSGSKVRIRERLGDGSRFDELCLEVELPDGTIERGYTYANLVALPVESRGRSWFLPVLGICGFVAVFVALIL